MPREKLLSLQEFFWTIYVIDNEYSGLPGMYDPEGQQFPKKSEEIIIDIEGYIPE